MKVFVFLSLLLLNINSVLALPLGDFDALTEDNYVSTIKALNNSGDYNFEGIVKLSNCSGSLIKFKGQPNSDQAYVLTNGHCLGRPFIAPGEYVLNKKVNRRMKIADSKMKFHKVKADLLVYGTMTGTDSAIYRLKETYEDIAKLGIDPFLLDDVRPKLGTNIDIISGYWERGFSCFIDEFIFELHEAGWVFTDSLRYSNEGCDTYGGTSGSPIIERGTRVVIAINNTGNDSGKYCSMNNPCERDESGQTTVRKGASYGQQTYQFYTCLSKDYKIDLSINGCELTK